MNSLPRLMMIVVLMTLLSVPAFVCAQPANVPNAAMSDPNLLGWMRGFPPPPDKIIRFSDGSYYRFPATRWSFSHMRQLVPSVAVSRGKGPESSFPRAERSDIDGMVFTTLDGRKMTWAESLQANYTDGIVILHRGKIVYERYFGVFGAEIQHSAFSVTKSFVGTLAAMLAYEGRLDPSAPVTQYVPELEKTAYGDATVRQVMDMIIGVKYDEVYTDPKSEIWAYARAGGMLPSPPNAKGPSNFYEFLTTLKKEGHHGEAFSYKTVNTEVLAWILRRASGKSLAALTEERIWSKLGAEQDACYQVDSIGTESGGGGLNTSLRDLARFGEMMRLGGSYNGQQIIPSAVVDGIRRGGDKALFAKAGYKTLPGFSYHNMWWISHNAHGAYTARGIHGQLIWIDPKAEMVIARFASHPMGSNTYLDPTSLPAYMAIAEHLMAH